VEEEITVAAVPAPAETVVWEVEQQPVLVVMSIQSLEVDQEHHQPEELEESVGHQTEPMALPTLVGMAGMAEMLQPVVKPMAVPLLVEPEGIPRLDGVLAAAVVQDTMAAAVVVQQNQVKAAAQAAAEVRPIPFPVLRLLPIVQEPGSMQQIIQTLIIRAMLV